MSQGLSRFSHKRLRRLAHRQKREVLFYLLPAKERASYRRSRSNDPQLRCCLKRVQRGNFVGLGFGAKETSGGITGDLAVRVYVRHKIPDRQLSRSCRVPRVINGITTDVIAVGTPRFHGRPVANGAGISHMQGAAGSLACVVTKPNDDAWYLLSACHVLAPANIARLGDLIVEPATPNAGAVRMAVLADFEVLKADEEANRFDAAIARLDRKSDVSNRMPVIGPLAATTMDPRLYQSVRKFGAGSLHTLGIVTDAVADVSFTRSGESYRFDDVVEITGCGGRFSEGGDSGALVVDALSNQPVGLVIGGARDRTYVSPIDTVLERFGVRLLQ